MGCKTLCPTQTIVTRKPQGGRNHGAISVCFSIFGHCRRVVSSHTDRMCRFEPAVYPVGGMETAPKSVDLIVKTMEP